MQTARPVALVLTALLFAACSKKPDTSSTPGPASATAASSAPAASAAPASPAAAGSGVAFTLGERLRTEAQNRPPLDPNADDVLDAFEKAGGGVAAKKQGLAATYKASFCEGGTTSDGAAPRR